jgi:hypothetical protein
MKVYRVEFIVHATAYIKADCQEAVIAKVLDLHNMCLDMEHEPWIFSGRQFNDPELPAVSFSPVMTVGTADLSTIEEAE